MIPDILNGIITDYHLAGLPFDISVVIDPLSVLMACIVGIIGLIVSIFSVGYMRDEPSIARFWFLIQLFIGGYMIVVVSGNLLFTFIGWEIVGLCCMSLASFWYQDREKARVGLKTGMILRIGDLALLTSILTIFVYAGTFNIMDLQQNTGWIAQLSSSGLLQITTTLFLIGVVVKAAQFPLQEWLPDMLVSSPSCFNALTECLAGPFLFARLLPTFHNAFVLGIGELSIFFQITAWIGIITALITAMIASTQNNIYKILAYSVSSVIGYMLTVLGLAGLSTDMTSGYLAGTFLLAVDAFVTGLLFLTAAYSTYAAETEDIRKIAGFKSKLVHRGMEVGIFAMIGVPPLSGFWISNWIQSVTLELAGQANNTGQYMLMHSSHLIFALLIVTGGITALYGLKTMWTIFGKHEHEEDKHKEASKKEIPRLMRYSLITIIILTLAIDFSVPILIPAFNKFFLPIIEKPFLLNIFEVGWYILPSLSTALSIVALTIGAYPAYQIFIKQNIEFKNAIINRRPFNKIYQLCFNRLYMDQLFQKIALYTLVFVRGVYTFFEIGIDRINYQVSNITLSISTNLHQIIEEGIDIVNYLVSDILLFISKTVYVKLEQGIDLFNRKLAERVFSVAQKGYKYTELEGISGYGLRGLDELFSTVTQVAIKVSQWTYPNIELKGLENFNETLVNTVTRATERLRDLHTGILSLNMLSVLIGIVLLAILLVTFGGLEVLL
jgi:NADH-quinone oxidoreductase subunit L